MADVDSVVGELVARVSGFGPLQPFLDDPTVEEIWINDPSRVFVARHGRHELTNLMLTTAQVQELVERMLKSSGRRVDISRPFVDAMLPEGHRLHVVLEGISRGFSAVNIRKFVLRAASLAGLVELGSLTPQAASFLDASVRAGLNILVTGGDPERARRPSSTASPRRSRAVSGSSPSRRSSSCASRTPTGCRCRPGSPGWRGPARSRCATW